MRYQPCWKQIGISVERYRELLHFCRQYPEWKTEANSLLGIRAIKMDGQPHGNGVSDPVAMAAEKREKLMTKIENEVLDGTVNMSTATLTYKGATYTYYEFLTAIAGMGEVPSGNADASNDTFISELESTMDSKNSFSQQTMIKLQSQTNKRDQAYDLISNALKSLNTVLTGNVNNM